MPSNDNARPEARRCPRHSPRSATRLEVFRSPNGTGPDIAVRVLDISATGARLALSESLPPGHALGLALYGPRLLAIAGVASVVWSAPAGDGTFTTGVEFHTAAARDILAALARA